MVPWIGHFLQICVVLRPFCLASRQQGVEIICKNGPQSVLNQVHYKEVILLNVQIIRTAVWIIIVLKTAVRQSKDKTSTTIQCIFVLQFNSKSPCKYHPVQEALLSLHHLRVLCCQNKTLPKQLNSPIGELFQHNSYILSCCLLYPQSTPHISPCHFLVFSNSSALSITFPNTVQPLFIVKNVKRYAVSFLSSYTFVSDITVCPTQTCDAPDAPVTITLTHVKTLTLFFYHQPHRYCSTILLTAYLNCNFSKRTSHL